MKVIEINSSNEILRTQELPDTYIIDSGSVFDQNGNRIFPITTHWHNAPIVQYSDGDIYDPLTGNITPKQIDLVVYKQRHIDSVRLLARDYIESVWPIWRQVNADAGIYPSDVKTVKDSDIVSVITESNRVEDLINDAVTVGDVDIAFSSINWPVIGA